MFKQLDRITFNPQIMAGQACIRGMRIPVSLILNLMANDKPIEEILEEGLQTLPDAEIVAKAKREQRIILPEFGVRSSEFREVASLLPQAGRS